MPSPDPRPRIYLAHPIATYGTVRETAAIALLTAAGFEVINPSERQYAEACGKDMRHWVRLAAACDAVALLPFRDGKMGSGMAMEARHALKQGRPLYRLNATATAFVPCTQVPAALILDIDATRRRNLVARQRRAAEQGMFLRPNTQHHPDLLAVAAGSKPRSPTRSAPLSAASASTTPRSRRSPARSP
jgi:nucleoside 2-deoxyribosyltransferase